MKCFGSGSGDRNFLGYRSGINYYRYGSFGLQIRNKLLQIRIRSTFLNREQVKNFDQITLTQPVERESLRKKAKLNQFKTHNYV